MKIYNRNKNVYEAATERFDYIFDSYDTIVVSCSGGKDSTVCAYLAIEAAKRHNKKFYLFYLDQEIEYSYTIDFIDYLMKDSHVHPLWFQIPCLLTNSTSVSENVVDPWNPKKKNVWIRPQKVKSIKSVSWPVNVPYTFPKEKMYGFPSLIKCMEQMFSGADKFAQILGLRADESLDRFRAVTKNPGIEGIPWSTKGAANSVKFYPIYDWRFSDVFAYFGKNGYRYNKLYDLFYKKGMREDEMRLSNPIMEKAYKCLSTMQEFEPKLIDRMLERFRGVSMAQEYAGRGGGIYEAKELPKRFSSWKEWRDYLLDTLPNREHAEIFRRRFEKQYDNDYVVKQQVNRILINDVNNFKKINNQEVDPSVKIREKWMEIL